MTENGMRRHYKSMILNNLNAHAVFMFYLKKPAYARSRGVAINLAGGTDDATTKISCDQVQVVLPMIF
jgi:hypothetical protein